jgi:hypothetical protein
VKEPGHDQFGVTDHSATAPVLKRAISERVIHRIPAWVSPNALALTSGVLAAMAVASVWLFLGNMRAGTVAGKVWMIRTALLLIIYGVCDQLDGMQARPTDRSSAFGEFLDHWVDTLITNAMTVPMMAAYRHYKPPFWWLAMRVSPDRRRRLPSTGRAGSPNGMWIGVTPSNTPR